MRNNIADSVKIAIQSNKMYTTLTYQKGAGMAKKTEDAVVSARVPAELLAEFDEIIERQSVNRGTAIRLLMERVVLLGRVDVRSDLDALVKKKR